MANHRTPGPVCGYSRPENLDDGTLARVRSPLPGSTGSGVPQVVRDYWARLADVKRAWDKARDEYVNRAIVEQIGTDGLSILTGILVGLLAAVGVLVLTTGIGAVAGAAVGSLGGGVGALPGAVAGAEIGWAIGHGILAWVGLAFLIHYVGSHLKTMGERFAGAIQTAWNAEGNPAAIDAAARAFAAAVALLVSILIQAIVVYLTRSAPKQGAASSLARLRDSLLFRRCPRLEPWLIANFARLRERFVPLKWEVLTSPNPPRLIPGTSIPESFRIKVGERIFHIFRDKFKIVRGGVPKGSATKHMGEKARQAPIGAFASQTDFPMSSLAAALDRAEAQLIFQPQNPFAKPKGLKDWEIVIDTTGSEWRVEHLLYTPNPKW